MTTDQLVALSAFLIIMLLGVVGWFVRKLVQDLEAKVVASLKEVKEIKEQFSNWRVMVEQNFVSFDTYQTTASRFTVNFENIFRAQAAHGEILARLDERSKGDDRLVAVVTAIQNGFAQVARRRR